MANHVAKYNFVSETHSFVYITAIHRKSKTTSKASFDKVHFHCVACQAAVAFHEDISYNNLLIGQDREHFSDIRDKGRLTFKLLTILNDLFVPAKFCGVFQ